MASPSTAYSIGAAIALPYKTAHAKTTMPAPIAAAPILRRTRRLLLTSKRCVVGDGYDMAPPERPLNNIPRWNCAATGTRLGERLRLSGGVPYLPHGVLLDRYRNSRDVRRWVHAPPEIEALYAVTAWSANSAARHALFCECWPFGPRSRSHLLCLDFLDLKVRFVHAAIYRDSGRMEVLDRYGRSFPHTQK
jgi:hypothetical protein